MNFRDLVFISVTENLSFSKAAEQLFISQPAVTKHIKELENSLQQTLFERKGNKIYLTHAGKITYRHLKQIRLQYDELEFELNRVGAKFRGVLRLGASSTISQYLLPAVIAKFHRRYPDIKVTLLNGNSFEMEKMLIDQKIDLAMVENASTQAGIYYKPFLDDEIIGVTSVNSAFAKRKSLTIQELQQIPIVLREQGSGTLEVVFNELHRQDVSVEQLNIQMHLGSTEAIKNFLPDFDGIALVSEKSIEKELQLKILKKLNIKNLKIVRHFRFATRRGHEYEIQKLFQNYLSNYNF